MARKEDFNANVLLPPGLTTTAIQKAIEYIEKGLVDMIDIYIEQANVFSALVGIYGVNVSVPNLGPPVSRDFRFLS